MLSAIVITKNEEAVIGDCLKSLAIADEIIVTDSGTTDRTNAIAQTFNAKIVPTTGTGYSDWRNDGLAASHGDWILYLDADERLSPQLQDEIASLINSHTTNSAFELPRKNIFLGKPMRHGGWGNDSVIRLFRRTALSHYANPLHEQPVFSGSLGKLQHSIIHLSHRDLSSMLKKTLVFTSHEAQARYQINHPPMAIWRFARVMITEFWLRFIRLSAWRDGPEGIIDGLFQVFNSFVIYARLWELQQRSQRKS